MDTRPILDPVQVQLQRQLIALPLARKAPYPPHLPQILQTIAGLCDASHFKRLGRRQVINPK